MMPRCPVCDSKECDGHADEETAELRQRIAALEAELAQLKQPHVVLAEAERLLTDAEVEAADFPAPADRRAMADVVELCKRDGTHVAGYSLAEAYAKLTGGRDG